MFKRQEGLLWKAIKMNMIWAVSDKVVEAALIQYLEGAWKQRILDFRKRQENSSPITKEKDAHLGQFVVTDSYDWVVKQQKPSLFGIFLKTKKQEPSDLKGFARYLTQVDMPIKGAEFLRLMRCCVKAYQAFQPTASGIFKIGPYVFNPQERCFTQENTQEKIMMTEKESELLRVLNTQGGDLVTKKELLKEVWAYDDQISTRTLESHIYALRKKMELFTGESFLVTESGGYRLKKE